MKLQQLLEVRSQFERDGFAIIRSAVSGEQTQELTEAAEAARDDKTAPGLRNLLRRSSAIKRFAVSGVAFEIAKDLLERDPIPVRAILFDKTPDANWYVTWHQDLTIPVSHKVELPGYGPWSVKHGVIYVQPPAVILAKMVSLRVHLDACRKDNGAIKFIAGSHLAGILAPEDLVKWREDYSHVACPAERGDIIAMRPLILHSSSTAESPAHRRVLHIEYAGTELPAGLEWAEA